MEESPISWRPLARAAKLIVLAGSFLFSPGDRARGDTAASGTDYFENRIRPVLAEHCYECHSAKAEKLKGGLRLDTAEGLLKGGDSGPAVVGGDPEKSLLIKAVRHTDPDLRMPPPKGNRAKLPEEAIANLAAWVKAGAKYPGGTSPSGPAAGSQKPHWAFQPISNPPAPAVQNKAWPRTSIDPFILAKIERSGLRPAPSADKRTLLRRATFDLTGLPPTPDEMESFLADDSPEAFSKVVDRLLDSVRYGERWGRHWLDVVRYADTAGETADYPVPVAWRYRNYVIDSFNADKPYDQFLLEQIGGDILARNGPRERYAERVTATGYLAISRRFGFDSENYHHLTIQDTIDNIGQTVMGLSLGCARCHNHKFDPVTTTDYYALYGIFESSRYAFPGSEQKQRFRALAPLLPPEESLPKWRAFETRVASLGRKLEQNKQPVPSALLASLDEMDGDFELQSIASGGSKGVLVPPWVYEGPIAVTREAQSPFRNLHAPGRVGASFPLGSNACSVGQSIHIPRAGSLLHVNVDFRVGANAKGAAGSYRFWLGAQSGKPAAEILVSASSVSLRSGDTVEQIAPAKPGQWRNLQLTLDLGANKFSGKIGAPGEVAGFESKALAGNGAGAPQIDFVGFDSSPTPGAVYPGIEIDNFGVQEPPIAPVATEFPAIASTSGEADPTSINQQIQTLVGIDGDFELQADNTPPATPWGPGPNSPVKISAESQSPFRNIYPEGKLGIRLPNSGAYNGFGQTLPSRWTAEKTGRLFVSFDFRCVGNQAGGGGSWRFYVGHGPGSSPALELFFNDREFFHRGTNGIQVVRSIRVGDWHQVQASLDLRAKTYTASISTREGRTEFSGTIPAAWDGGIDYTFIDSYGHLNGVKPSLDADNFAIVDKPLPAFGSEPLASTALDRDAVRQKVGNLRGQLAKLQADAEKSGRELNSLLVEGPFDLAYAVVEGTPRNSRIQIRGEPDKPGNEVPRGLPNLFGGGPLPKGTPGSGRLELAQWLTGPSNPLAARVMANRIWQYHFGRGLVKTPNDFGTRGQAPTHPELLDHLATRFIRSGWSVKAMHRLILLSATYRQSADPADAPGSMAAGDTSDLYASFARRRLGAEETRDSILFVSGELDSKPGFGHPFPAPTTWGYSQHGPFSAAYETDKRSVYLMTQRIKRHPFLALFDGADPNASTADRRSTTVPTQALFFLNDPFVHAKAEKFAARLRATLPDDQRRVEMAYRLSFGRAPSAAETFEAGEFLATYRAELAAAKSDRVETAALAAYLRSLFGSNEFLHLD